MTAPGFSKRAGVAAALMGGALFALLPVLLVSIPPLLDYPGHLAKVFIAHELLTGHGDFAGSFQLNFRFFPNYAIDAVVLPLLGLGVDAELAGRIFLALTMLLIPVGIVRVHARLFGAGGFWPLLGFAFVFNQVLMFGFVNFLVGIGLSLNGFAWWLDLRRSKVMARAGFCCAWVVLCFFAHLIGALVFLGLVLAYETADLALAWRAPAGVARRLPVLLVPVAVLAALYAATPLAGEFARDSVLRKFVSGGVPQILPRIVEFLHVADAYSPALDRAFAGFVALAAVAALVTRRFQFEPRMIPALAGLSALYLIVPESLAGTDYLPERMPVLLLAILLASCGVRLGSNVAGAVARIAIVVAILVRSVSALQSWQESERVYVPMLHALDELPRGSRIYTALNYRTSMVPDHIRPWRHFDCFGAIRDGLIPASVFTNPAQDAITRTPDFAALGGFTPWDNRVDSNPVPLAANDMLAPGLLASYGYLLAIRPDLYQRPLPATLHPIAHSGEAVLFRIAHAGDGGSRDGAP